jgi:hypothetical protein
LELDTLFWRPGLTVTPRGQWAAIQRNLASYRRRTRPLLLYAIAAHAGHADLHVLRTPQAVRRFVAEVVPGMPDQP